MLKRILNNPTLMSWAAYFVQFGSLIFVLPLIINAYDENEQSFWFLMQTIIGFAILADSGFGSVLMRGVSYFKAGADYLPRTREEFDKKIEIQQKEPNFEKLTNLLTTTNRIYIYISFLIILLLGIATIFVWNVMKLANHRKDLWIAYFIVIPYCILLILNVRWRNIMRGLGYVAKEARFNTILGVLRIMIFVILLSFKSIPAYLFVYMFIDAVIKHIYLKNFVLNWFRNNNITIKNRTYFDKQIFQSLWSASWKVGGILWGNYFIEQGDNFIIAQSSDATLIACFLLTKRFLAPISTISRITLYANLPTIYNLAARKEFNILKKQTSGYILLGLLIMSFAFLILGLFGNQVLGLISDTSRLVPLNIFIILAVSQLLELHSSFHGGIYSSTNHIPFLIPTVLAGAIILGVGFYIMPIYSILGVVLVRFIVQFCFNNWYAMVLSLRLMKWPIWRYFYELPIFGGKYLLDRFRIFFK